jgi:hypothetical protein
MSLNDPDSINAAHQSDQKLLDALQSIGVDPKSVRLRHGGAKNVAVEGRMYAATLTVPNVKKHNDAIAEHADHLASRGIAVSTSAFGCGHSLVNDIYTTSLHPGQHSTHDRQMMKCPACRTS